MEYNELDIITLIKELYPNATNIIPIGHHHLKRHLVFSFLLNKDKFVIKLYFKPNKYNREVSALTILNKKLSSIPKLVNHGIYKGVEYLVMEYIDALILEDIVNINKQDIYKDSGIQIANIHKYNQYNYYGVLESDLSFRFKFNTWSEYFNYEANRHLNNLAKYKHPNQDLINKAISLFKSKSQSLTGNYTAVLTHNDFSDRNIFIKDNKFLTLIDFEQSCIQDPYRELAFIEYHLNKLNKDYFKYFLEGYKQITNFDINLFNKNKNLYYLHFGLAICSWSLDVDIDHYKEGIELIKQYIKEL